MAKRLKERQVIPAATELPRRVPVPDSDYPMWPILCPGPRETLLAPIISRSALVIATHYLPSAKKRRLCVAGLAPECAYCGGSKREVLAYLAVWSSTLQRPCVVSIPRVALRQCRPLMQDEDLFLRELRLQRHGFGIRGRLTARISLAATGQAPDDAEVSWERLYVVLLNIWRIDLVRSAPEGMTAAEVAASMPRLAAQARAQIGGRQ
jgi:hypothetical protein